MNRLIVNLRQTKVAFAAMFLLVAGVNAYAAGVNLTTGVAVAMGDGPCDAPTAVTATTVYQTMTISWTSAASKFEVSVKPEDGDWTDPIVVKTTSCTMPNLAASTNYQVRVRTVCAADSYSEWTVAAGPFTTDDLPPFIGGSVFGGGRMADVNGYTVVDIVNCDSIGAVYGGNDIAGRVRGDNGSTITVGTVNTVGSINIGSVYGGGNGYYVYDGHQPGVEIGTTYFTGAADDNKKFTTSVTDVDGGDSYTSNNYIPLIKKTQITVSNDYVKIDSLFGGAKNAFVTNTAGNSTDIDINGGIVYAVFGGNNYGGTLGTGSTHDIDITMTTFTTRANVQNTPTTGFGREYGVRYLYGGGNKVVGQNVDITMTGGQVDTLFAGGNSADVGTASVTINCAMSTATSDWVKYGNTLTKAISEFLTSSAFGTDSISIDRNYTWNGTGVYNVRTLFGGNNAADMSGIPTLTLTSGHVGTVYGGGNAGDMNGSSTSAKTVAYRPGTSSKMTAGSTTYTLYNDDNYDDAEHDASSFTVPYSTNVIVNSYNMLIDYLYGGCQKSSVTYSTWVLITNGHIGTVYGGCNISGDVGSAYSCGSGSRNTFVNQVGTYVEILGGHIYGDAFAGSNGYYHCNNEYSYVDGVNYNDPENLYIPTAKNGNKKTPIPTHNESHIRLDGGIVVGNLYGGANLANVGFSETYSEQYGLLPEPRPTEYHENLVDKGLASLRLKSGVVYSNVYGGSNMAMVNGTTDVKISGGSILGALYGGNDKTGKVTPGYNNRSTTRLASDGYTEVNESAFLQVVGKPYINVVYGGGNGAYDYSPTSSMQYCPDPTVGAVVPPVQASTFVDIHIDAGDTTGLNAGTSTGGYIDRVFGGGNGVSVDGNITVFFNLNGASSTNNNVGTIFGGNDKGDLAFNTVPPRVVLLRGKVHDVYGGCNKGNMVPSGDGNNKVFIKDENNSQTLETFGNVGSYIYLSQYYFPESGNNHRQDVTAEVTGAVYGGCNQANVEASTLVYVESGNHADVKIFGGNDISGTVSDTARVVIAGGSVKEIYGGGNGDYIYHPSDGTVYSGSVEVADEVYARPYCNSTDVQLRGGTCLSNVYAGGLAGDCGNTRLNVEGNTVINGILFGGGRGNVDMIGIRANSDCGVERIGNVEGTATTNLISCSMSSTMKRAYGGGHNGDCQNTQITLYETFRHPLQSIYGGCVASNVNGTANVLINGYDDGEDRIVDTLYGGNDYSGKVQNTRMTVNSGRFLTAFGAGNGDYNYTSHFSATKDGASATLTSAEPLVAGVPEGQYIYEHADDLDDYSGTGYTHLAIEFKDGNEIKYNHQYRYWNLKAGCQDTVPYSMDINFTINGGTFLYNIYGGGNMGLVGNRDMVANDMHQNDDGRSANMGLIKVNVHGGDFHRHIFTGASGRPGLKGTYFDAANFTCDAQGSYDAGETLNHYNDRTFEQGKNIDGDVIGKQLVYGLKILNMDGGTVEFSVYGGSESVDDGYPFECIGRRNPNLYTGEPHWKTIELAAGDGMDAYRYAPGDSNTTLRPSSILNIMGGIVNKSIYGGGYQGNIYGSVYVNVGRDAINESPVWTREYGTENGAPVTFAAYKPNLTNLTGQLNIPGREPLTMGNQLMLNTSVYNASDWGEARDNPYFNTRGVFGGVTNILINGKGYRTTVQDQSQSMLPSMNIAFSIIGSGTSTEGGDVHRLITIRHYGDYYNCPIISKDLASIQRADKVILDSVFVNLTGEQDAFSAYASPNYSLCRIDTVLFMRDNIVSCATPGIYIGHLVSMKSTVNVVDFNVVEDGDPNTLFERNDLYTNNVTPNTTNVVEGNITSNDMLDNLHNLHGQGEDVCNASGNENSCEDFPFCAKLTSERGTANNMGAYNTLVLRNGSYIKVSPYIDVKANVENKWWNQTNPSTGDPYGMDGKDDPDHPWGNVHGWMYMVAYDTTRSYVYAADKEIGLNPTDGGFVATCDCDNIWSTLGAGDSREINYSQVPVVPGVNPQPYRIWRVGKNQGSRNRHITLVANAKPDSILNYEVVTPWNTGSDSSFIMPVILPWHEANDDCSQGTNSFITTDGTNATALDEHGGFTINYDDETGSQYAYAVATLELPPSSPGNFYIMTPPVIDLDNGGQLTLTDQVFESQSRSIFQAEDLWLMNDQGQLVDAENQVLAPGAMPVKKPSRTQMSAILDNPNYTFGLAMSTITTGSNFAAANSDCWMSGNGVDFTAINTEIAHHATSRNLKSCDLCWPYSYVSGNEYLTKAGGYVSNQVVGGEGSIPTMVFTLTYSKNLSTTITRDITFTLEEYTQSGEYVGPVDVTVTISTVIKEMDDLEAPVLAMFNEGITNEYIRKVTIPASFVQRDLYLEGFEWDLYETLSNDDRRYFNLQDTNNLYIVNPGNDEDGHIKDNKTFAIVVNPTESSSENITNHLGWYHIERNNIDVFGEAYEDRTNNARNYYNGDPLPTLENFKASTLSGNPDGRSDKYNSYDYNNDGTYDTTYIGSKGDGNKGILIGTLDGRATASVDVRLLFDGLRIYKDYYPESPTDPKSLGIIKLRMHWYNNKISRSDIENGVVTDGTFDIIIKLRTRAEGDTFYMAYGDLVVDGSGQPILDANGRRQYKEYIQRNVLDNNGNPIGVATAHSYMWQVQHGNFSEEITTAAPSIRDNPDAYLTTFEEVMKIYREGDVIAIMQTLPIKGGENEMAQAISGTDYSIIQVIRYSGSHFKFPSMGCANFDPLVDVTGVLNMRNVWFNGSGCTRTKTYTPASTAVSTLLASKNSNRMWTPYEGGEDPNSDVNKYITYSREGVEPSYTYKRTPRTGAATVISGSTTIGGSGGYFEDWPRERVMMPVHAPMIYVHGGGSCNFSANVRLTNNINVGVPEHTPWYYASESATTPTQYEHVSTTYLNGPASTPIPGGAVALIGDDQARKPSMQIGNLGNIYGNTVIDPGTTGTGEIDAHGSLTLTNSGAGVYVYDGILSVGSNNGVSNVNIEHNYYLKATEAQIKEAEDNVIISRKVAIYTDDESGVDNAVQILYFELDTVDHAENYYTLNNVYLTRNYNHSIRPLRPVRVDKISDVVRFRGILSSESKIGISKWFPGYIYDNLGAYVTNNYASVDGVDILASQFHNLYNSIPRDTIGFATLTTGSTVVASYVYDSAAFFNDSVYFPTNGLSGSKTRVFNKSVDEDLVLYSANTSLNPNFKDHVYIFHHDYLDPSRLYFQRCASFGKGVKQTLVELEERDPETGIVLRRYTINDYARGDSIAYWWNKDATCVASTDTLVFRVGGGFFPYTYHWDMDSVVYEKNATLNNYDGTVLGSTDAESGYLALKRIPIQDRQTFGTNAIANLTSERFDELRARARVDTLVMSHLHMNQQLIKSTYLYECTAYDLTGRCPVHQPVMVRVGKITSEGRSLDHKGDFYVDSVNFLRHRNPYAAYRGYLDDQLADAVTGYYTEFPTVNNEDSWTSPSQSNNLITPSNPYNGAHIQDDGVAGHDYSNQLLRDFEGGTAYYLHADGTINTTASGALHQVNDYLYYRINAPGVDSSSFHDHVDTAHIVDHIAPDYPTGIEGYDAANDNLGKKVTVFLNHHKAYVSGSHHYSDDYLFPYIRPWYPDANYVRQASDFEYDDPQNMRRDTLGFEIRVYDTVYNGSVVDHIDVHRFRWNKRPEHGEEGIYYKTGSMSTGRDAWLAVAWTKLTPSSEELQRETVDFYPDVHVPIHTHGTGNTGTNDSRLGIRRAGYSHLPMHWFNHGFNRGTLNQRVAAESFTGKPYHDGTVAEIYGTDQVKYVTEKYEDGAMVADANGRPIWVDDPKEHVADLYKSQMVPRYLRIYRSYKVTPHVEPAELGNDRGAANPADRGEGVKVWGWENYETEFTEANRIDLTKAEFCPGGVVHLSAYHDAPTGDENTAEGRRYNDTNQSVNHARWEYMGWDFDPSSVEATNFVVSDDPNLNHPTVYYSPGDYWYQTIKAYEDEMTKSEMEALALSDPDKYDTTAFDLGYIEPGNVAYGDYHEDYDGNITIYTEKGLAWLISKVNGFNGQNARTFRFNTITLDYQGTGSGFDMSAHKWTPLGNAQNNFEGLIEGVDGGTKNVVTNIIVNERNLPFVGMFGYTDHARIQNFELADSRLRGNMYVGGLIGQSNDETEVTDMTLQTNVLIGEYVIGGAIGKAVDSKVTGLKVNAPIMYGNAIYAGGGIGTTVNTDIDNTSITWYNNNQSGNDADRLNDSARIANLSYVFYNGFTSVTYGGIVGNNENPTSGGKSDGTSRINNNYVQIRSGAGNLRVGGLIGAAEGLSMNNNYVYGDAHSSEYIGGLAGFLGNDVSISNCYYVDGMTGAFIGNNVGGIQPKKSTTFKGAGNRVHTAQPVDGVNNLTRLLNKWVDLSDDSSYYHWRSDMEGENSGYPVFGIPDLIPVADSLETAACDEMDWDGITFTESGRYVFHVVDSNEYVDSTFILLLTVNQSDTIYVSDTITIGEAYEGYGFTISDAEVRDAMGHTGVFDIREMIRMDSLYNQHGCDSVVVLTLYVLGNGQGTTEVQKLSEVKVYPNPTLGIVNVEGSDLQSVEVYDNISRRVLTYTGFSDGNNGKYVFDLGDHAAGAYYVRVRTAHGTVVKKVIKK